MGLALLAIIWLITFFSTYFFVAKTWWPHGASTAAAFIDGQFALTLVLMGIVFVAAQGALGLFVWQYRERPDVQEGRVFPRQHQAGSAVDRAHRHSFRRAEPDGQQRLGP